MLFYSAQVRNLKRNIHEMINSISNGIRIIIKNLNLHISA